MDVKPATVISIEKDGVVGKFTASLLHRFVLSPAAFPKVGEYTLDGGRIVKDDGHGNREIVYEGLKA